MVDNEITLTFDQLVARELVEQRVTFTCVSYDLGSDLVGTADWVGVSLRDLLLEAGTLLGPRQVGLLAGVGMAQVSTRPRPRVVVMSTGSEIVPPGGPLEPGQIYDSNSFALAAAVTEAGGVVTRVGAVEDDARVLMDTLRQHLEPLHPVKGLVDFPESLDG